MAEHTKIRRDEVLEMLNITEDTLHLYEQELELASDPDFGNTGTFTEDDLILIKTFHKLRDSGLTHNEIKLLTSVSEVLKGADFEGNDEIKNLLALSPIYRLKQSLALARQELNELRSKAKELEEALKKASESGSDFQSSAILKSELESKQKTINILDKKLSEAVSQKSHLESLLSAYKEGNFSGVQIKGKKTKELYKDIVEKELENAELKKKNSDLASRLEESILETGELREELDEIEESHAELGEEIEERYKEQIASLKSQIEFLLDKKQKEWETYYINSSDQHRKELLTLQRKHEQEILRLKEKIKEQIEEMRELRFYKNPLLGFISKLR